MTRVGRWMGAIVVEGGGARFLVGNPKEPCALVPETLAPPYTRALPEAVPLAAALRLDAGDAADLASRLAARLLIERNGSVSERLWRLVAASPDGRAQWLVDIPAPVWEIVRDTVLRCT